MTDETVKRRGKIVDAINSNELEEKADEELIGFFDNINHLFDSTLILAQSYDFLFLYQLMVDNAMYFEFKYRDSEWNLGGGFENFLNEVIKILDVKKIKSTLKDKSIHFDIPTSMHFPSECKCSAASCVCISNYFGENGEYILDKIKITKIGVFLSELEAETNVKLGMERHYKWNNLLPERNSKN